MSKDLHIVFQVLNFLSNPFLSLSYNLSSDEKLLLIFLAKHKGVKGIYPSVLTLSKELQRSDSAIRRSLNRLEQKKLIVIDHIPGKSSHYSLFIPTIELSTTPSVHASTDDKTPLASTLGHPRRPRQDTPSVHARLSIKRNNTDNNTERSAPVVPLSLNDFVPHQKLIDLAAQRGLNEADVRRKFLLHVKERKIKDLDSAYEKWILDERIVLTKNQFVMSAPQNSRVIDFCDTCLKSLCVCHVTKEKGKKHIAQIMNKMGLSSKN